MASTSELSTHARKLQDEEIERLVKCRVRSEIEARKAAEATMKRAVHDARELKKELMIMRQEKEESKQDTKKAVMVAATTPAPGGVVTKEDLQKKLTHERTKRKEVTTQLEAAQHELAQLRDHKAQQDTQLARATALHDDALRKAQDELKTRQRELEGAQDEAKKLRSAVDEAKRKCQRAVKEKKEELQQLLDENAQLTKRCDGLERLGDENAKLRKLLEKAKDKQGGVADEWQRRLDQREQAFLRQEHDNKLQLAEKQREIDALVAEKRALTEQLEQLESDVAANERAHAAALKHEHARFQELVASTKQLQERVATLKDAGRAADRARLDAEARLATAEEARETAEAAADAVESRAEKLEKHLQDARQQLEKVEKALKKKGITLDFLLNHTNHQSSANSKVVASKEPKGPEDHDVDDPVAAKKKVASVTATASPAMNKDKTKAASLLEPRTRVASGPVVVATTKSLPTKAKVAMGTRSLPTAAHHHNNNHDTPTNHSHADREPTPERTRK